MRTVVVPAMLFITVPDGDGEAVEQAASLIRTWLKGYPGVPMNIPGAGLTTSLHLPRTPDEALLGETMWELGRKVQEFELLKAA